MGVTAMEAEGVRRKINCEVLVRGDWAVLESKTGVNAVGVRAVREGVTCTCVCVYLNPLFEEKERNEKTKEMVLAWLEDWGDESELVFVGGDFNAREEDWSREAEAGDEFWQMLEGMSKSECRVTSKRKDGAIDYIFSSGELWTRIGEKEDFISDHLPVIVESMVEGVGVEERLRLPNKKHYEEYMAREMREDEPTIEGLNRVIKRAIREGKRPYRYGGKKY